MAVWLLPSPEGSSYDEADEDEDEEGDGDELVWESLDDETPDDRHEPQWMAVLPWNLPIVRVFQRCQPQVSFGMGVLWQGVTASEVHAACVMSHVPPADWPRYIEGVQAMAIAVANARNSEAAEAARRKGR